MKLNYSPRLCYDGTSDAALISGSAQLASSAINSFSVANSSKADRKFMNEMWDKNRTAAIADRDYANTYNLPSNEMARLKAAGLNPNLIYGKAGGDMASAPIRSTDFTPYHREAPQIDLGGAVGSYFQIQSQQSQLANMAAQRSLMDAQTNLANANANAVKEQTPGYTAESGIKAINLDIAGATKQAKIDYENGKPTELNANIARTITETKLDQIKTLSTVELQATEMVKAAAETEATQAKKAEILATIPKVQAEARQADAEARYMEKNNMKMPQSSMMYSLASAIVNRLFPETPGKGAYPILKSSPEEDSLLKYFDNIHKNEMMNAPVPFRKH